MSDMFGIRAAARAMADRYVEARRRRQTARILERLPAHLRKDIGLSGDYADMFGDRLI